MAEKSERPRPHGDPLEDRVRSNPEDNRAQRDSDAPPDESVRGDLTDDPGERSDRARGRGSSANGVPAFDEDEGARRKKQYDGGADLVSSLD